MAGDAADEDPGEPETHPLRVPGGGPNSESLTPSGMAERARLNAMLRTMLWLGAKQNAHRRRASMVDSSDLTDAFDQLVKPSGRSWKWSLFNDVLLLIGGGLIGAGVNYFTTIPALPTGTWLPPLIFGGGLSVASLAYKYGYPT